MLMLALLEGYLGYSLVDDLLSGMGLAIGYSVAMSIPFVGANLAQLALGRAVPRAARVLVAACTSRTSSSCRSLIGAAARRCTSRSSRRGTTRSSAVAARDASGSVVGMPTFPGQAPRSLGLLLGRRGVLFLLGGLVQINPIWLWGPYHVGARRTARSPTGISAG